MSYLSLIRANPQQLGYGALHYFFSSLGQTFFISISVPFILSDLDLSSQQFSSAYAIATVLSAGLLMLVGKYADVWSPVRQSFIAGLGLAFSCLSISFASNIYWLIPGLLVLRFFGQGTMTLIGSTLVARYFTSQRGKALSIASLGLAVGEMLLPVVIIRLMNLIGWREMWWFMCGAVLIGLIPLSYKIIKNQPFESKNPSTSELNLPSPGRIEILKKGSFYLILPAFLFLPFFATGIFIHQNQLAAAKGWSMEWMATTFMAYGAAKLIMSITGGILIDRFSAIRVFIFFLIPLACGLLLMIIDSGPFIGIIYMFLLGTSASLGSLTGVAVWAELYGVKNLGAIKSMTGTFLILATAIAPVFVNWGFKFGLNIVLWSATLAIFLIVITNFLVLRKHHAAG